VQFSFGWYKIVVKSFPSPVPKENGKTISLSNKSQQMTGKCHRHLVMSPFSSLA
jgi:hypothetical protein